MAGESNKQKKGRVNPVAVGIAGAVVGAGVGVAGALVMQDKENRKKVKKVWKNVKESAVGYVKDMQKGIKEETAKQLDHGQKEMKEIGEKADNATRHKTAATKKIAYSK